MIKNKRIKVGKIMQSEEKIYLSLKLDCTRYRLEDGFYRLEKVMNEIKVLRKTCPNLIVQIEASFR